MSLWFGHGWQPRDILRYHAHMAKFRCGRYLIVPLWYASTTLQTFGLASGVTQEPWLDHNHQICRRRVPERYNYIGMYKYYTNQQTYAVSYTAVADIMFDAGWSESIFVNKRKVKRHTAAVSLYVAVGLRRHFRVHRQDKQQSGCEKWYHSHFDSK